VNRRYVDHVQVIVAEDLGVEGHGGYYDTAEAVAGHGQNHMLQLLSSSPWSRRPPSMPTVAGREGQGAPSIRPIDVPRMVELAVRGQYVRGTVRGKRCRPCRRAARGRGHDDGDLYGRPLEVDNWRWAGVPLLTPHRQGPPKQVTEVTIQYRQPPLLLFEHAPHPGHNPGRDRAESSHLTHPARRGHLAPCGLEAARPASAWSGAPRLRVPGDLRRGPRPRPTSDCFWTACWGFDAVHPADEVETAWD